MSDPGHDPAPDRAALDELARAFGIGDDPHGADDVRIVARRRIDDPPDDAPGAERPTGGPADAGQSDAGHDDGDDDLFDIDGLADRSARTELIDLVIGETPIDPPEPTPESIAAPPPPRIIRIDDITGAVGVGDRDASIDPDDGLASTVEVPVTGVGGTGGAPTVISIDADDLPDALYVAGSLDSDASRSIVFIEDDTDGDAMQPESERDLRRGIEPRMRERRVQVKRAQSRKRLKWVILAIVLLIAGIGVTAVFGSSLFAVREDQLTVVGAVYTDPARLDDIEQELIGRPTLRVDTQRIERELESIPWVAEAKVTVRFPHSATIEIREREAMITYQGPDNRFRVVDREGRVLDVLDKWPIAYVLVEGPDPADLEPGQFAPQGYIGAAELAKNLTGSVRGQVDHLEVTADGQSLKMFLRDGTEVRFGDYRNLFTKLVRLETRLADPEREPGPIDVATG